MNEKSEYSKLLVVKFLGKGVDLESIQVTVTTCLEALRQVQRKLGKKIRPV